MKINKLIAKELYEYYTEKLAEGVYINEEDKQEMIRETEQILNED